jgi:hypothetical protein
LSVHFQAKFRDALARAGLLSEVDPAVWRQDWVVHSKAVGDGRASLSLPIQDQLDSRLLNRWASTWLSAVSRLR